MLQTGECKFSVSREARTLWEKLERENRTKDFSQEFWRTFQGNAVQSMLRIRRMKVIGISMEKRCGDQFDFLYVKVVPPRKESR